MKISKPCLIDTFKDEYHLNENESLDEARDMMKYKPVKKSPNRPRLLHPEEQLTDEEEQNERIAEQIANKYGLLYIEQSCIGGKSYQFNDLVAAKRELSKFMKTGDIEQPFESEKETVDWLFVFWS